MGETVQRESLGSQLTIITFYVQQPLLYTTIDNEIFGRFFRDFWRAHHRCRYRARLRCSPVSNCREQGEGTRARDSRDHPDCVRSSSPLSLIRHNVS